MDASSVLSLKDAVSDTVAMQYGAGLLNQLLSVRQEYHLAAFGDSLLNDRGRRQRFASAGRQIEADSLQSPSQGRAGFLLGVLLIRAEVKSHRRPLLLLP